jgi:hypothetical protein
VDSYEVCTPLALLDFGELLARTLLEHQPRAIEALLKHPLAARMPPSVRAEAAAFMRLPAGSLRAPIETLQYCHRMAHLIAAEGSADQRELFEQGELFEPRGGRSVGRY